MRLTRTPVKAAYRPTPVPPAPSWSLAPAHPVSHARADDAGYGETDYVLTSNSLRSTVILIISITCLIFALILVGFAVLYRAYNLTPATLMDAVFSAGSVPVSTEIAHAPDSAKPADGTSAPPAHRGAITSRAWSMWREAAFAPLEPASDETRGFQTIATFPKGFDIIDGATVQSDQTTVHISGIAPLPATTICQSAQATKFACGLQARASLSILISGDKLLCYPDVSLETQSPQFLCQSHGRDVGLAQIEAGFALPSHPSVEKLAMLVEAARSAHAGAWNGDWTIIPPGGASSTKTGEP